MKLDLPQKPPGHAFAVEAPRPQPTLLKAGLYRSADESAARRQAIMTRLNERRSILKAALRART